MIGAYCFIALAVLLGLIFLYLLDLLIFRHKKVKAYEKRKTDPQFLLSLEGEHKKKKNPVKKNFLLFLIVLCYKACGEENKAKSLLPFVRDDAFFGIKKSSVH